MNSCKLIINKIYVGLSGYNISNINKNKIIKSGGIPTYGEITLDGIRCIMCKIYNKQNKIFYDLGSGIGKMVIYSKLKYSFKKVIGVELSVERHKIANIALNRLKKIKKINNIKLINNNLLKVDLSNADVIYISNLCFTKELINLIECKFNNELKKGTIIFSSQKLDKLNAHMTLTFNVKMTWTNKGKIYKYIMKK